MTTGAKPTGAERVTVELLLSPLFWREVEGTTEKERKRYIVAINKNGMKQHIFTVCILIKKQTVKFIHILKSADLSPKSLCIYTGRPLINTVHNKTPKNTQGKIFLRLPFR